MKQALIKQILIILCQFQLKIQAVIYAGFSSLPFPVSQAQLDSCEAKKLPQSFSSRFSGLGMDFRQKSPFENRAIALQKTKEGVKYSN
ncbi:hypothetical protein [Psychrobacter lutiphocae]|uniref:hypothetical protein n=1 Tax=Psychrobacter lutiphocae TaxID=540500 RepID=UPI000364CB0A|nr:hypothetical protein [Psychrobacter lutiphocae]